MNNELLVSIIIPVFNTDHYLRNLGECLVRQTFSNLEIIFVDDGSTDDSYCVLEELRKKDNRIIVIRQLNKGRNYARSAGLNKASGSYVTFIDSDDLVEYDYIERLAAPIKKGMNIDVVIGGMCDLMDDTNSVFSPKLLPKEGFISFNEFWREVFTKETFSWNLCGKLYKKSGIAQLDQSVVNCEDLLSNWTICKEGCSFYCIEYAGYIYRCEGERWKKYLGDMGSVDAIVKIGNELPHSLEKDELFIRKYVLYSMGEFFTVFRNLLLNDLNKYKDKVSYYYPLISSWKSRLFDGFNAYPKLRCFFNMYFTSFDELIHNYEFFIEQYSKEEFGKQLFLYGAGKVAKRVSALLNRIGVKFNGFIVSRNAEKHESPDAVHKVYDLECVGNGYIVMAVNINNIGEILETMNLSNFTVLPV